MKKTKNAAESAKESAIQASSGIRRLDSLIGFASVSKSIDEIKDACRSEDYKRLSTLFDNARKSLIIARENHPSLNSNQQNSIHKYLVFLKSMELEILIFDLDDLKKQKPKFMKTLIEMSDGMTVILNETKKTEVLL